MADRINPETGVVEEQGLFGWHEKTNESGRAERVNPETGITEERGVFFWGEKTNESGRAERVNSETGVTEERGTFFWGEKANASGRAERVNPETGITEERGIFFWGEKTNESGRAERVNPRTGLVEERGIFFWHTKEPNASTSDVAGTRVKSGASAASRSNVGYGRQSSADPSSKRSTSSTLSPGAKRVLLIGVGAAAAYLGARYLWSEYDHGLTIAKRSLPPHAATTYGHIGFGGSGKWIVATDGFKLRVASTETLGDIRVLETARSQSQTGAGGPFLGNRDGARLFSGGDGLAMWDTTRWRLVYHTRFPLHGTDLFDGFTGLALSADEQVIYSGSISCIARTIDSSTGRLIRERRIFSGRAFCGHAMSLNGTLMASYELENGGKQIKVSKFPSLAGAPPFPDLPARPSAAQFSNDGSLLAVGLADGSVQVMNVEARAVGRRIPVGEGSVAGIAFLPGDGRLLAAATMKSKVVKVIDVVSGDTLRTLALTGSPFAWTLIVSPDGRWLAESEGKTVAVWNLEKLDLYRLGQARQPVKAANPGR